MTVDNNSAWRKSSYSGGEGDDCVEVAMQTQPTVRVRDSKNIHRTGLTVSPAAWSAFTGQLAETPGLHTRH